MMTATNIHYEYADRVRGLSAGGIGAVVLMAQRIELVKEIDRDLRLLKRHLPYHESDHVLNIAFNILAGGQRIEHLELRRNDEVYLDALGAKRIPDPTTAGDFCRRFCEPDVITLMDIFNRVRLRVWEQQPSEFFDEAIVDADGTIVSSDAECKQGMDFAYNGQYGYHPLLISLANTAEPLFLFNRSGNRPSQELADVYLDKAVKLGIEAGFRKILLRGDTKFAQTKHLDRWDAAGNIRFIFGYEATDGLKDRADELPAEAYSLLKRRPRYQIKTAPREKPERFKEEIVRERGYENVRLIEEMVAEFDYKPHACKTSYRMIVVRKLVEIEKGQNRLFEEYRYLFYITNDRRMTAQEVVFLANDRCDQENLIAQLKDTGTGSMRNPLDNLHSNWAYMVMSSLAWTLKAWCGLLLPVTPGAPALRHAQQKKSIVTMEFTTFVNGLMRLPCQIIKGGRRIIYRLMSWNPWLSPLLRLSQRLHQPLRC